MAETMRRLPTQRRSREKVQRILDAAEELLASVGYEKAVESPQPLLAASGVSRGAFYSYFTSPEMAMETVALGYIERSTEMADEFAAGDYADWRELVEHTIDVYSEYYRTPSVRELWLNGHLSPVAVAADERGNLYIGTMLVESMRRVDPAAGRKLEVMHGAVAIEILDYLLRFAFRHRSDGDPDLIVEAKRAMVAYLESVIAK
ncbi:TetR/AcrR family transcriptional regulator [Gordonia sp. L191]|uniref:TetR/AcrR family transcriptional regulator n=1 Tax=Gordonia sp. L191 TaxID=2982699 RepID=UPI0024C0A7E2|nr:TetR/AcrR family transcriptional regulator [Gordonia sp. L191]WHU48770.1 TetR/AcrR family transcriptional regulator [Gordonia sp. L191]